MCRAIMSSSSVGTTHAETALARVVMRGPCRAFGPIFEAAAVKNPDIKFGKIDTEAQQGLAREFNIRSIPTLMVLRDGILLLNQPGMLPAHVLDELIQKVRDLDMNEVRRSIEAGERA